ncbi:MAG: AAA family ATPase [Anaerolineae bacterium]|nr:AAA family ATPase [Anaerolineae bacterium]
MRVSHIELENWKNFRSVSVDLPERVFLVGPNASGKSNFLDAFRFLRDLALPGGGLQRACSERGGVSKIRCLAARQYPAVTIRVVLGEGQARLWRYEVAFSQDNNRNPVLTREVVYKADHLIMQRPDDTDRADPLRLSQTALEQINANQPFRDVARFFESISYLHLVPQIIRNPGSLVSDSIVMDAYGRQFLERVARTPENTRNARLRKIKDALVVAVPQLKDLRLERDQRGIPHLIGVYEHWRPRAGKQDEEQFSDGTLRLLGLLWALQEGEGPLLLEEPELSLHSGVVRRLAGLIYRMQKTRKRQVLISTHSVDLLSDPGISGDEVLMLKPDVESTRVVQAADVAEIHALLEAGMNIADAVFPHTEPERAAQLELFTL